MQALNNLIKKVTQFEISRFFLAGVVATLVDWFTFFFLISFGIHYQISLFASMFLGAITNYIINRIFTFKSKTKYVATQVATHLTVAAMGWLVSAGIMFLLVELLTWNVMLARIITTLLVFVLNYVMHKNITFNKRIFRESSRIK